MWSPRKRLATTLLSLALALCCSPRAQAQTQPAKPAAATVAKPPAGKPAKPAPSATGDKTLGSGGAAAPAEAASAPRRPILTRDELRACFADEASIRERLAKVEADRAPLEVEKQGINVEQARFRDDRAALDKRQREGSDGLNAKFKDFAARIEASNARVEAFNTTAAKSNSNAVERERTAITAERTAFDKERTGLEAEKTAVVAELQAAVDAYNLKATALDQRVTDWNQRNAKANDVAGIVEAERKDWLTNCSNRRYREEDENAIKAGR